MSKKERPSKGLDGWLEKYFQAKADGNSKLMKFYEAIILKLGGKIPKL